MGKLLDAAYNEEYGAETTDQAALNLMYLLGFNASPGNFSVYGKSDERYHTIGGNEQIPQAIANYLGHAEHQARLGDAVDPRRTPTGRCR